MTKVEKSNVSTMDIIDSFIEKRPKIKPSKKPQPSPQKQTSTKPIDFVTETLAHTYFKQEQYQKAVEAYHHLCLKYPEKSSFFADRILEIQKILK